MGRVLGEESSGLLEASFLTPLYVDESRHTEARESVSMMVSLARRNT